MKWADPDDEERLTAPGECRDRRRPAQGLLDEDVKTAGEESRGLRDGYRAASFEQQWRKKCGADGCPRLGGVKDDGIPLCGQHADARRKPQPRVPGR